MGFSLTGTLIAVSILLPNFLILFMPPQKVPKLVKPHIAITIAENVGRAACVGVLVFSQSSFNKVNPNIFFWLMSICTAVYYLLWIRYVFKDCDYAMLIKPLGPVPIPMVIFPILSFAFTAIWINSLLLFACVCVFAVGHVIRFLDIKLQLKETKETRGLKNEKTAQKEADTESQDRPLQNVMFTDHMENMAKNKTVGDTETIVNTEYTENIDEIEDIEEVQNT